MRRPEYAMTGREALHVHLDGGAAVEAAELLQPTYWNDRFTPEDLRLAHLGSAAWVGARDGRDDLVATARAVTDGAKYAWI